MWGTNGDLFLLQRNWIIILWRVISPFPCPAKSDQSLPRVVGNAARQGGAQPCTSLHPLGRRERIYRACPAAQPRDGLNNTITSGGPFYQTIQQPQDGPFIPTLHSHSSDLHQDPAFIWSWFTVVGLAHFSPSSIISGPLYVWGRGGL